jgi:hypothetical protein
LQKALETLKLKKKEYEEEETRPDTTAEQIARVEQKRQRTVLERVDTALKMEVYLPRLVSQQGYAHDSIQLQDEIMVAKIKLIQAERDKIQAEADITEQSQQCIDAEEALVAADTALKAATLAGKTAKDKLDQLMKAWEGTPEELQRIVAVPFW